MISDSLRGADILLFAVVATALVAYSYWIYLRVELRVPARRWLATIRAAALVLILLLLFNPRLPVGSGSGVPARWVLLDGSLSMQASATGDSSPWTDASDRAEELAAEGWRVVRFGGAVLDRDSATARPPDGLESRLGPALGAAAEAGARRVRVLSDARFEDAVAIRSALEALPLDVTFETFGGAVPNAGVARLDIPDLPRPDARPVAELELFGEDVGDSVTVEIREEGGPVATVTVPTPSPGLRTTETVELPAPQGRGRVRYTASIVAPGDGFPEDDDAVAYVNVGFEAGGLVLVSFRPDWEPRYLLPVMGEVTGLNASGYLRAGPDRYLTLGRAADRARPVDSATVRSAVDEAAIVVIHGLGEDAEGWIDARVRGGRRLVFPVDPSGAALAGLEVAGPRAGEWYVSPDVPTSPIAGSLAGLALEGLPPLTDVMVPDERVSTPPLQLQLRGAGAPESAFALLARSEGRRAVVLASGFWRWSMRDAGREAYRRLWSGVAGWLLAESGIGVTQPRPARWVFERGGRVRWRLPADSAEIRIRVSRGDTVVMDTTVTGGGDVDVGVLPSAAYGYDVIDAAGDTLATGRFDVASTTLEMLPRSLEPTAGNVMAAGGSQDEPGGRPLRTLPWPFLLVIALLCGEWIVRRRSGLR